MASLFYFWFLLFISFFTFDKILIDIIWYFQKRYYMLWRLIYSHNNQLVLTIKRFKAKYSVKFSADNILKLLFFFFFFIFPWKHILAFHTNCQQDLTFHASCLQWRQFAWNVKTCFMEKNEKKNVINLSSAELAQRVVIVQLDPELHHVHVLSLH